MLGKAGTVEVTYTTGLRLASEIANLMHTFMENGIDVYVISASMEEVVEVFLRQIQNTATTFQEKMSLG